MHLLVEGSLLFQSLYLILQSNLVECFLVKGVLKVFNPLPQLSNLCLIIFHLHKTTGDHYKLYHQHCVMRVGMSTTLHRTGLSSLCVSLVPNHPHLHPFHKGHPFVKASYLFLKFVSLYNGCSQLGIQTIVFCFRSIQLLFN